MKSGGKILICILFLTASFSFSDLFAQLHFERRIIIESDSFYAVQINPETQIGRMYIGNIYEPIDSAKVYALPAGAKQRNLNPMPFAWTLYRDTIYCINSTEYAQNSPVNSLKIIPLVNLEIFDPLEKPTKNLLQAAYANCPIKNTPLMQTYKKYVQVDDLYYDILFYQGDLYQFISVQNEITRWQLTGLSWASSEAIPFPGHQFFMAYVDSNFHIVNNWGSDMIYPYMEQFVQIETLSLNEVIMVEDRDNHEFYFLTIASFSDHQKTVNEILFNIK